MMGLGSIVRWTRRQRAARRGFNPYIAGAPIFDEHLFFGREDLTLRVLNVLRSRSVMITGEPRIGKTTFLHHLKKVLLVAELGGHRFFPVFVDLQGVPEPGLFHALMAETVETLALAPRTLALLRFTSEGDRYDECDFCHDLEYVIRDLRGRTEKEVKLALLADEVDVLNEYSERSSELLHGAFMAFSENLVAVMSGVGTARNWRREVSRWYEFLDEIEITTFTREEAEALMKTPVARFFRYQPEAVERVLELSHLRPYLIQKFCIHAVNHMLEEGRTTIQIRDVEAARHEAAVTTAV